MKRLHIDCSSGAAGDMLAAALLELHPAPDAALSRLNAAGIPGVIYERRPATRCGIAGTRLVVIVNGRAEHAGSAPGADHAHPHRSLADIMSIVDSLSLPESVRSDAAAIYRLLADAESRAHGRPVGEVHFHELGALDAIADIAAVCFLMGELAPIEITASPVNVGSGTVRCAHGILPVPAPATAFLLKGIPSHADPDSSRSRELCTPTGAALLKHFVHRYGPMPLMAASRIGHGAGSADFPDRPNLLRCTLGDAPESAAPPIPGTREEDILELACNLDDMTGEELAFASERLFAAGALDVAAIPATMKKGRPGTILLVLCPPESRSAITEALFRHTTTLGIRLHPCRRCVLERHSDTVTLPDGTLLRRKTAALPGLRRAKYEFDDLAALARAADLSLRDILTRLPPP